MGAGRGGFWSRAWRGAPAERSSAPDPADMGTAFGLDASFDALPGAQAPSADPRPTAGDPPVLESLWAANRLNGRSVI